MKATLKFAIAIAIVASTVLLYRRLSTPSTESVVDVTAGEATTTEETTATGATDAAGD